MRRHGSTRKAKRKEHEIPEYKFRDRTTNKSWTAWHTISERDEIVKDPNIEQMVHGSPRIVTTTGYKPKIDTDFKSKLKAIKKSNPGSTIDTY